VIGHSAMQEMIKTSGYQKVSCRWVPRLLTDEHKKAYMDVSLQLPQQHAAKCSDFLLNTMSDDESSFHHFDPKIK
jgi:hypothetical protein